MMVIIDQRETQKATTTTKAEKKTSWEEAIVK